MIDVGSAVGYLDLNTDGFKKGFASAMKDMQVFNNETATFEDKLNGVGSAMTKTGSTLTKSFTVPLVGAGAGALKLASDFETGMKKVQTIADTSVMSMDSISQGVIDLSGNVNVSTDELSEGLYEILSATGDTSNALSYLEISAKLAKGGFTDVRSAVDGATTVLNAYGLQGEEAFQKVADIMMVTQNVGKTTVGELAGSMAQVIPTAAAMGVEFDQVGASLAAMTAQGTPTAQATTMLNSLFAELGKSGTQANIALEKAVEDTQYAGMGFQDMIAAGVPLNEILQILRTSAEDNGLSLLDMFGSIEAGKASLQLTGEGADIFTKSLDQIGQSAGVTQKAFETMNSSSGEQFKDLLNTLKNIGIEFGLILLPVVLDFAKGIKDMLQKLKDLDSNTKKQIIMIASVVAAVGPLLMIGGKLLSGVSNIITITKTLGLTLSGLAAPVLAIIAVVAALAAAWATNFGGIRDKTKEVMDSISSIISSIWQFISTVWNENLWGIKGAVEGVMSIIEKIFSAALDTISSIFKIFANIFKGDWDAAGEELKNLLWNLVTSITDIIGSLIGTIFEFGVNIVKGLWDGIKSMGSWITDKVTGFFSGIVDGVKGLLGIHSPSTVFADIGKNIMEGLNEGLNDKARMVADSLSGVFKGYEELAYNAASEIIKAQEQFNKDMQEASKVNKDNKQKLLKNAIAEEKRINSEKNKAINEEDKRHYNELENLAKEHVSNTEGIYSDFASKLESIQSEIKSRTESIFGAGDLFKSKKSDKEVSSEDLIKNMEENAQVVEDFTNTLEELNKKELPDELREQLNQLTPDSLAELQALNSMTSEQLAQYVSLWTKSQTMAAQSAQKQYEEEIKSAMAWRDNALKEEKAKYDEIVKQEYNYYSEQLTIINRDFDNQLEESRRNYRNQLAQEKARYNQEITALKVKLDNDMRNIGKSLVEKMVEGVNSVSASAIQQVKSFASSLVSAVNSELGKVGNGVAGAKSASNQMTSKLLSSGSNTITTNNTVGPNGEGSWIGDGNSKTSGNTYNFYSPKPIDEMEVKRQIKKVNKEFILER